MVELSIFFDVETLPTIDLAIVEMVSEKVKPPASMKKAETIEKWELEERPAAILEAISKTALDGGTGRIAAIAFAIGDGVVAAATSAGPDGYTIDTERHHLTRFFAKCDAVRVEMGVPPILVGHNIAGFDVRWLWKRSIVLGVQPPYWWPVDAKPWDADRVVDTMEMWEGRGGRISLDRLARTLGVGGKGSVNGSQVSALWDAGDYEAVRLYCGEDVDLVRSVWRKITGHVPAEVAAEIVGEAA